MMQVMGGQDVTISQSTFRNSVAGSVAVNGSEGLRMWGNAAVDDLGSGFSVLNSSNARCGLLMGL